MEDTVILDDEAIEKRAFELGQEILSRMRDYESNRPVIEEWSERVFDRLVENEKFRVKALRFVDVLPALDDGADLVRHLQEYFTEDDLSLPGLSKWWVRLSKGNIAPRLIAPTIRKAMKTLGKRFLAGEKDTELVKAAEALREQNINCSLDLLGEAVVSESEADAYLEHYINLIESLTIHFNQWKEQPFLDNAGSRTIPRLNLSVKPSSLYSQVNPVDPDGSIAGIAQRIRKLFRVAIQHNAFVMLDMEQYELKDIIIGVVQRILMEHEFLAWSQVGLAMQAYLRETEQDLDNMIAWAKLRGVPITIRLVRGAYWDAEMIQARQHDWPIPVWTTKSETDACYERCQDKLLRQYPIVEPAIATHNIRSIAKTIALAEHYRLSPDQYEFQMLTGMAEDLRNVISDLKYRLRIYLPFGKLLPGMAYLVRRLLENSSSQSFLRMSQQTSYSDEELLSAPVPIESTYDNKLRCYSDFHNEPIKRFVRSDERDHFQRAISNIRQQLGQIYPLLIDGKEVSMERTTTSVNPSQFKEKIGYMALATFKEVDLAIEGATKAFVQWSALTMKQRCKILKNSAQLLREQRTSFAAWEILEAGKGLQEADADVTEAIDFIDYYADQALKLADVEFCEIPGEKNQYWHEARGVGAIIPPWNFPLAIMTGMLSASIVTGNTVILKPSSYTPVVAYHFVKLLEKAGIPPGVVNFITGPGKELGEYIVSHPKIEFIAFTGSLETGIRIRELAAKPVVHQKTHKHIIAEMGGKNATIIDSDADLDDAVLGVAYSAFGFQGQKCSACSRVIVVGPHYENFLTRISEAAKSFKMGPADQPGNFMGPVISSASRQRIKTAIEEGKQYAKIIYEANYESMTDGYYIGPVIFRDVPVDSQLAQNEIFGPVLSIMHATTFEEAINIANNSYFALTGGVYSRSPSHLEYAKKHFKVGNLYLNRKTTGALVNRQPFGGGALSGTGFKAGGPDYLLQFLQERTITENTMRRGFAPEIIS